MDKMLPVSRCPPRAKQCVSKRTTFNRLRQLFGQQHDRDVDFADASLVWLAERSGLRQILTVDVSDFSMFRLSNGKRFDLFDWT